MHAGEAVLSTAQSLPSDETTQEQSLGKVDSVNISKVKPEALKQQKQDVNSSTAAATKFETLVIRAHGGVSVTLSTENGVAVLSVRLNNLVRTLIVSELKNRTIFSGPTEIFFDSLHLKHALLGARFFSDWNSELLLRNIYRSLCQLRP